MNQALPGTVIFLGTLAVLGWWLWCQQQRAMMAMPAHPAGADGYWQTPFYLRNNTPVFGGTQAIVPSYPGDPWAIASYYGG